MTDFIIVLRNKDAIRTFGGNVHFSIGAGLSAAAGIVGRSAEADVRAGDGGYAACYTYSCSKGTPLSFKILECSEVYYQKIICLMLWNLYVAALHLVRAVMLSRNYIVSLIPPSSFSLSYQPRIIFLLIFRTAFCDCQRVFYDFRPFSILF